MCICISKSYLIYWSFSLSEDHLHLSPYLSYVSGALAGCAATIGSYPFDLLRTILASQGEPKVSLILPLVYKTLFFLEHLWHVQLCVIDWSDEDFRVRDKCVSVGFQQEGNREICRSNTHYFKIQTYIQRGSNWKVIAA